MYIVLLVLAIIVCVLLGFIVLIQNPKGGGLSSSFSASSQLMGVQKTGDFLEKGTWFLAITLMVLSLAINVATKGGTAKAGNAPLQENVEKASKPKTNLAPGAFPLPSTTPATKPADSKKK